jgi:hypothetical protein
MMHAESSGLSEASYAVPEGATKFTSIIGIDDFAAHSPESGTTPSKVGLPHTA